MNNENKELCPNCAEKYSSGTANRLACKECLYSLYEVTAENLATAEKMRDLVFDANLKFQSAMNEAGAYARKLRSALEWGVSHYVAAQDGDNPMRAALRLSPSKAIERECEDEAFYENRAPRMLTWVILVTTFCLLGLGVGWLLGERHGRQALVSEHHDAYGEYLTDKEAKAKYGLSLPSGRWCVRSVITLQGLGR